MLRPFPGTILLPDSLTLMAGSNSNKTLAAKQLNSTNGQKIAYLFRIPMNCTIDKVGVLTGTVTTSQAVDVRLESLTYDSTGTPNLGAYPSGSLKATDTKGTIVSPASNTWYWVPLDALYVAVKNEEIAIVLQWTGTAGAVSFLIRVEGIAEKGGTSTSPVTALPFVRAYNGTDWNQRFSGLCVCGIGCADGTKPFLGSLVC